MKFTYCSPKYVDELGHRGRQIGSTLVEIFGDGTHGGRVRVYKSGVSFPAGVILPDAGREETR